METSFVHFGGKPIPEEFVYGICGNPISSLIAMDIFICVIYARPLDNYEILTAPRSTLFNYLATLPHYFDYFLPSDSSPSQKLIPSSDPMTS